MFGGHRVDTFHRWQDTQLLAVGTYLQVFFLHVSLRGFQYEAGNLEIGEAHYLGLTEHLGRKFFERVIFRQLMFVVDNVFQLADEPRVNLGQFVDALDGITFFQRLCDGKDTQVGRIGQFIVQVREAGMVIAYEAVHALTNHTQSFLDNLFKRPSDGHDFAHRLHAGADAVGYAGKLVEVPARNLANQVIQLRSHIG